VAQTFDFVETDAAKIYTTVLNSLMDGVGEPLYPGDERRIFSDALVAVLVAVYNEFNDKMKQRTLQYARGAVLDAIGDRYAVVRSAPASASAVFRFSLDAPRGENIIIDAGTKLTADGVVYFTTDSIAVIQSGALYADVSATCTEGGSAYNGFGVGTIATLVDLIPYVSSVRNITVSSGGDDGEPYTEAGDEHYRARIRLAPAAQSTAGPESAYRFFAMSADPDIADVAIDSPDANVINIYPLMAGGALPDEATLAKVLAACNADDVRPLTDLVNALAPEAVSFDIELKYYCTRENEADTIKAVEADGGAIDQYVSWQTSALGRDINPDQLRKLVLCPDWDKTLVGADRLEIVKPAFAQIDNTQVARFSGNLTVTHEVTT
jgi:phage-related baseplate assembly protein